MHPPPLELGTWDQLVGNVGAVDCRVFDPQGRQGREAETITSGRRVHR
jgi:hypothetical protein